MTPSLSLSYSSHQGNGLLGLGWSIEGMPSIGRCPQTVAQDGGRGSVRYDANDRFCLDGDRLVAVSGTYGANGTEYRTEIETFSKVVSYGTAGTGPAWFEVHTKSGQRLEFGNTTDSRVLAQGKTTARDWMVNKVSDTKGNYFTITYINDGTNGQVYPSRVDYTGNAAASLSPYNSVRFVYDTIRPDVTPAYHVGSLRKTTVRLTNAQTFVGETLVNDYQLAYQSSPTTSLSQLSSLTLCTTKSCLPATNFTWNVADSVGFDSPVTWKSTANYASFNVSSGDFDGNGQGDLVLFRNVSGTSWSGYVSFSKGDGSFASPASWSLTAPASGSQFSFGDFDGDGRTDLLLSRNTSTNWQTVVGLGKGDGTFSSVSWLTSANYNGWTIATGDFNGDGRTDLVLYRNTSTLWQTHVALGKGDGTFESPVNWQANANYSGWTLATGDFNGDGNADLALYRNTSTLWQTHVALGKGDGTFESPVNWQANANYSGWVFATGDFNGDGRTDLVLNRATSTVWQTHVALGKGDGAFEAPVNWQVSGAYSGWSFIATDFNNDGRSDIGLYGAGDTAGHVYTALSKGEGTFLSPTHTELSGTFWGTFVVTDSNGDGRPDWIRALNNATSWETRSSLAPIKAYGISSVADGLGAALNFSYAPLSAPDAPYLKDIGSNYPIYDFQAPMYVTKEMAVSDGIGGVLKTTYAYAGAKSDQSGRGFLGFRQMTATYPTGIVHTTRYRQDHPYAGLVARQTKVLGAVELSLETNVHNATALGGTRYQVSLFQSQSRAADLDGTILPVVTTAFQYDAFGNATEIVVAASDGHEKTTTNTFSNDDTNWLLGRLTKATVASLVTSPSSPPPIAPIDIIIGTNTTNLNVWNYLLAQGLASSGVAGSWTVTVASGVTINSKSTSLAALDTGLLPSGSTLKVINNGIVVGAGGAGGSDGKCYPTPAPVNGLPGGSAFRAQSAVTVVNNGSLWGGGGGGGTAGVSGGGGGAGAYPGSGGSLLAAAGTLSSGGAGGVTDDGTGGAGGGLGTAGGAGTGGCVGGRGTGGAAGAAVDGNSFVNWTTTGDRKGPLN